MKLMRVLLFSFTFFIMCNNIYAVNNYAICVTNNLRLRDKPDINSKIIGSLKFLERVEILGIDKNQITVETKYGKRSNSMLKIKTKSGLIGYSHGSFLHILRGIDNLILNDTPYDIKKKWPTEFDEPNAIYNFKKDNIIEIIETYYDQKDRISIGKYEYNGKNKVKVYINNMEYEIYVLKAISKDDKWNNVRTLMIGYFIIPIELIDD